MKLILAGIVAMFAACVMSAPALAQANAQGGDVQINLQYCPQVVSQYASADQSNSGGGIGAVIAQELGISQDAVNSCLQNEGGGDDGDDDGPAADQYTPPGGSDDNDDVGDNGTETEEVVERNGETIIIPPGVAGKTLANTGGVSAASILLPAGALIVVSGMMAMWFVRRRG